MALKFDNFFKDQFCSDVITENFELFTAWQQLCSFPCRYSPARAQAWSDIQEQVLALSKASHQAGQCRSDSCVQSSVGEENVADNMTYNGKVSIEFRHKYMLAMIDSEMRFR